MDYINPLKRVYYYINPLKRVYYYWSDLSLLLRIILTHLSVFIIIFNPLKRVYYYWSDLSGLGLYVNEVTRVSPREVSRPRCKLSRLGVNRAARV